MNNTGLKIFEYEMKQIRIVTVNDEPWFVGKDICEHFGDTNYRRSLSRLDEDEKGVSPIDTLGGRQNMLVVNESGLYSLLFFMQPQQANLPKKQYECRINQLKAFKRWVTHEVLPAIRRHGAYVTPAKLEELMNDPDAWIKVLTALKEERAAKKRLQLQAAEDKPKVIFADAVSVSEGTILIGELAKILKGNGIEIGQNRLFERLRQDGYLIKRKGTDYNAPTQRAMELGLFKVKETAITHSDGHVTISKTTKVTGKGQQYFINLFLGERGGDGQI